MNEEKIVIFSDYCSHCAYYDEDESDPKSHCWDCLDEPSNIDSHRPLYFKEKED